MFYVMKSDRSLQSLGQAHHIGSGICVTHWLRMDHSTSFHSLTHRIATCSMQIRALLQVKTAVKLLRLLEGKHSILPSYPPAGDIPWHSLEKSNISWPLHIHTPCIFTQLPTSSSTIFHYFIITYLHVVKFLDWNSIGVDHI